MYIGWDLASASGVRVQNDSKSTKNPDYNIADFDVQKLPVLEVCFYRNGVMAHPSKWGVIACLRDGGEQIANSIAVGWERITAHSQAQLPTARGTKFGHKSAEPLAPRYNHSLVRFTVERGRAPLALAPRTSHLSCPHLAPLMPAPRTSHLSCPHLAPRTSRAHTLPLSHETIEHSAVCCYYVFSPLARGRSMCTVLL